MIYINRAIAYAALATTATPAVAVTTIHPIQVRSWRRLA
jgi:hypothetical protein